MPFSNVEYFSNGVFLKRVVASNFNATIRSGGSESVKVLISQTTTGGGYEYTLTLKELSDWAKTGHLEQAPQYWHELPAKAFLTLVDPHAHLHYIGIKTILAL